jgi:WD40 repeat protein
VRVAALVFLALSFGCASVPPPHVVKPDLAFESRALTDFAEGTAFSPDSSLLATAHADGRIRLFSVERAKEVAAFGKERQVLIRGLRFTPDGAGLITLEDRMEGAGAHGTTLRRWHLGGRSLEWSKDDPDGLEGWPFDLTPDGKGIVVRSGAGWALRDAATGELVGTASERDDLLEGRRVRASLLEVDGRSGATLVVHDASGKELARHAGPFRHIATSPDGATVAAISAPSPFHDADIALFDAPTLHERARIPARDPDSAVFAPGGRLVVRARDETLVIDPASAEVRARIPTVESPALFSPDGALAAVEGRVVRVFEVATGREVASLDHPHLFRPVQFLRGGRQLVVQGASVERPSEAALRARADFLRQFPGHASLFPKLESDDPWNVRIWDVVEGRELVRYEELWGARVRVSPDETHLAWSDCYPSRTIFLASIPR